MNKKVSTPQEALDRYGPTTSTLDPATHKKTKSWPNESKWMTLFIPPEWFTARVKGLDGKPCKRIYMNKDMVAPFAQALQNVKDRGLEDELKTFDGCFNIRDVRGTVGQPSTHTYGLAVDLNAGENPLGGEVKFSTEFLQCFRDAGFTCGADFKRKDGQHFSYAWE